MKFEINDVIKTTVPKEKVKLGSMGTIVFVFEPHNEAYEVEFVLETGIPYAQEVFLPDELEKYEQ